MGRTAACLGLTLVAWACEPTKLVVSRADLANAGGLGGCGANACAGAGSQVAGAAGASNCSVERCNGSDDDCDGAIDGASACPQDCTGVVVADVGYAFCTRSVSFAEARDLCGQLGLALPILRNAAENDAAVAATEGLTPNEVGYWLDASPDAEGVWRWRDGSAFWHGDDTGYPEPGAYNNWVLWQPSGESCAAAYVAAASRPGQWATRDCAGSRVVLCVAP